jgi:Domain of unknown function (DUF4388)
MPPIARKPSPSLAPNLTGQWSGLDALEIIELARSRSRPVSVHVSRADGRSGKLHFRSGNVQYASALNMVGMPAVAELLSWQDAEFRFVEEQELGINIQTPFAQTLMDALDMVNESVPRRDSSPSQAYELIDDGDVLEDAPSKAPDYRAITRDAFPAVRDNGVVSADRLTPVRGPLLEVVAPAKVPLAPVARVAIRRVSGSGMFTSASQQSPSEEGKSDESRETGEVSATTMQQVLHASFEEVRDSVASDELEAEADLAQLILLLKGLPASLSITVFCEKTQAYRRDARGVSAATIDVLLRFAHHVFEEQRELLCAGSSRTVDELVFSGELTIVARRWRRHLLVVIDQATPDKGPMGTGLTVFHVSRSVGVDT